MNQKASIKVYEFKHSNSQSQNKHPLAPQWPFRLLICGNSGSGKTNLLLNLIYDYVYFNKIYLYAKDLEEDKYQDLIQSINCLEEKSGQDILFASNDKNDIVEVDDLDPNYMNLVIFDDFVTEKDQKKIEDLFVRGRKRNASIVYISQSYFNTPKIIRLNCNYFAFFKCCNRSEIGRIGQNHASDLKEYKFLNYFNRATKDHGFLLIDLKTNKESLKYRKNFDITL